jgi:cytoskeletal protein RodZ
MLTYLNNRRKKGQSTLEYAVLIIIIIGALLSIQVYIKRGIQGRLKSATDDIGDQFSPGNTNVVKTHSVVSTTAETFHDGTTSSTLTEAETTSDHMNSTIINAEREFWGSAEDQAQ